MANDNRPLAADPYAHQAEGPWKLERMQSDREVLSSVLEVDSDVVYNSSAAFVGRERDLFRFVLAMRFLYHTDRNELRDGASIFRILSRIFAIEGIAPANLGNEERIKSFLVRYLSREEKSTLLHSYLFTAVYPLGGDRQHQRHLMHAQAIADNNFRAENALEQDPEYCSTGPLPLCFCAQWLQAQPDGAVNEYVRQFGRKLYQMRCAVVHDATPVVFGEAQDQKPPEVAVWSLTLVDAFTVQGGGYITYETGLLVPDTVGILMSGLRRCFEDGARF